MIDWLAGEIETRLKSLGIFKAVDRTVTAKMLQAPPSAAVFLDADRRVVDDPTPKRELHWDIVLMFSAVGQDKGKALAGSCIDTVRDAFTGWLPPIRGGVMPAKVQEIRLEGIERTVLVYTGRVTMEVMPTIIQGILNG